MLKGIKAAWIRGQRGTEHSEVVAPMHASSSGSQDSKVSCKPLAKSTSENPGMSSPSSTHGGSKGLALEGLGMSTGQHCPQHKDMCAFLKAKKKKVFPLFT